MPDFAASVHVSWYEISYRAMKDGDELGELISELAERFKRTTPMDRADMLADLRDGVDEDVKSFIKWLNDAVSS